MDSPGQGARAAPLAFHELAPQSKPSTGTTMDLAMGGGAIQTPLSIFHWRFYIQSILSDV
jgi:hypothetical protein